MARKDKEWMKVRSKWKCKVSIYIVAYCAKWLLTKHLKEVHGLLVEKAKLGRLSTFLKSPQHRNHVKMNVYILRNAMPCKGGMIKRLLVVLVPKLNMNGIS
jgi:hypothetical protein